MENIYISEILKVISQLLELYEKNIFKINSYKNASIYVKKLDQNLSKFSVKELKKIEGIGKSIADNIFEITKTGSSSLLLELLNKTPPGIIQMLKINGLSVKKIKEIWVKLDITTLEGLFEACRSNKISKLKGFGLKTQETILSGLKFFKSNIGKYRYSQVLPYAISFEKKFTDQFINTKFSFTGGFRRKMEVVKFIEIIIGTDSPNKIFKWLENIPDLKKINERSTSELWTGEFYPENIRIKIYFSSKKEFYRNLLLTTGSDEHLNQKIENIAIREFIDKKIPSSEHDFYNSEGLSFIPPELREGMDEVSQARSNKIPKLIELSDIKGIIHAHSTYSDGIDDLAKMAMHCKGLGFEYLGITDHSKTASYAGGLKEEDVRKQHVEIERLNKQLAPFKIFKGIESDILSDGSLDYSKSILNSFDFVIASIHSGLKMDQDKATERLIRAIQNPFTTILGHPTGRLLLRREGYPIDHKEVIDACKNNNVIIELNANPNRLDLDWRWINYAIEKKVLISINPDAHSKEAFRDLYYGICIARKGGLTKTNTFNTVTKLEIEDFFKKKKIY